MYKKTDKKILMGVMVFVLALCVPTAANADVETRVNGSTISVVGGSYVADTYGLMSIGWDARAGHNAFALGYKTNASENAYALGYEASAMGYNSYAIGRTANASAANSYAIGGGFAEASGSASYAIGSAAKATGDDAYAIGSGAEATEANAYAIGYMACASAENAIGIGTSATATHKNSVALGAGSVTGGENEVSVGAAGAERTISNVKAVDPAEGGTYAATTGQLYTEQQARIAADDKLAKDLTDETTRAQSAEQNLQNQITSNYDEMKEVGAMSAALAGLHYAEPSGEGDDKFAAAVSYGGYRSKSAAAVGVAYKPNSNIMVSVATSIGNSYNSYNAGVSYKFGKGNTAATRESLQKQVNSLQQEVKELKELVNKLIQK